MSSLDPSRPALVRMFDEVSEWESRAVAQIEADLRMIEEEEREARRLLAEAERRIAALGAVRRERADALSSGERESAHRKRVSVQAALAFDRELLLTRCRGVGPLEREVPAGIGVLVSAEPASGPTRALLVVLPVPYAVYEEGAHRGEDLATALAFRSVAAVHELLATAQASAATIRFATLHRCLAIQIWLGEGEGGGIDLREPAMEHLGAAFERAGELREAGLEVYAVWIAPDLLIEADS